ncbi:beta-propeller domain-containing protein (plasmid) [Pseudoalteromonas sp. T1lg65]|uniref:beta-propeller domain-containing protein n=1 Tax=Pseudoalteromonas sp. T1lg65 TaxID=2077101 RepID=UPI003F790125
MKSKLLFSLAVVTGLSACGESSNDSLQVETIPKLTSLQSANVPLKAASSTELERLLKNGMYMNMQNRNADPLEAVSSSVASDFSTTNQLVDGVNESDRVKFDGRYLYLTGSSEFMYHNKQEESFVRIVDMQTPHSAQQVSQLTVSNEPYTSQNLYKHDERLVSISKEQRFSLLSDISGEEILPAANYQGRISLVFSDVELPSQASVETRFNIDGELVGSRLIDTTLFIVAEHIIDYSSESESLTALQQYQSVMAMDINSVLPKITNEATGEARPLILTDQCYIPANTSETEGYTGLTTITQIDINNPTDMKTSCVSSRTSGFYMSAKNLYLYDYLQDQPKGSDDAVSTSIWIEPKGISLHKFALQGEGEIKYVATGEVEGNLGFQGSKMALTRFHERADKLHLVTSYMTPDAGYKHRLYILAEQSGELKPLSILPNDAQPTPIGKVDEKLGVVQEDVYAVRYFDDKAYVVTFEHTDPLYAIDISDASNPKIIGSLEVPGYSSYLHPVSENLLLGIGQHIPETSEDSEQAGAKVSLFDVSNPEKPTLVGEHRFAQGYTPLEYDYQTFAYLKVADEQVKFTLPIVYWRTTKQDSGIDTWYQTNELAAFDISLSEQPQLNYVGSIHAKVDKGEDARPVGYPELDRGVIQDDKLYYIHGNYIWVGDWNDLSNPSGPK